MSSNFNPYSVVYTVLITERGTTMTEKYNKYLFKVNPKSNKYQIKMAVEQIFGRRQVINQTFQSRSSTM